MRQLMVWRELLSPRHGYAPCVKVDGRWYWAYDDYDYFQCLFTDCPQIAKCGNGALPEGLEQYAGADDEATHLNLQTHLCNLTLDALMPMKEEDLKPWLLDGRCPGCGAKG